MMARRHGFLGAVGATALVLVFCGCPSEPESVPQPPASPPAEKPKQPPATAETKPKPRQPDAEGFVTLGLDDFEVFHGKPAGKTPTWTADGDLLKCTGQPRGYLRSKKDYGNFTLRCDFRFPPPAGVEDEEKLALCNSGFLVYITGKNKLWPKCLEVQGKQVEMASIKSNSRDVKIEIEDRQEAREKARKPVGEWNSIEILSKGGALTSILNGTKICENKPSELTKGAIGLQSEGFAVEFRNLRIREE